MKLTEEQTMLLETAENFCRERSPIARVRDSLVEEAHDPQLWQEITDLGWLGVAVPEEAGGLGMGFASIVPIVESMGRTLMGTPYLATSLAIETLAVNGGVQSADTLAQLATGAIGTLALTEVDGSWLLSEVAAKATMAGDSIRLAGEKCQVLDAAAADHLICSVSLDGAARLVLVHRDQLPRAQIRREVVLDETRRSYTVSL